MADIVINPAVGKIDFFAVKGDNVTNTLKLTGNTLLVTGPLSASSISTGGGGAFVTSVQPTANFLSKFTGNSTIANSLIYDNGTNVGIGTTSPADKFHVIGNVRINGGDILNWSGQAFIQTLGNYDMFFRPNSTLQMILTGNGNLGIGNGFTNPLAKLHVSSTTSGATLLRTDGTSGTLFSVVDDLTDSLMSVNNSAGLPVLEVFADDRIIGGQYGANDFVVRNNKVGIGTNILTAKLQVTSSASSPSAAFLGGNVGIGTTSPIYTLDIPTTAALTRIGSTLIGSWQVGNSLSVFGNSALDQTNAANYALLQSNQGITYLNAASGQSIRLRIANTDKVIVDSNGNLGIGTTSAGLPLTVYNATAGDGVSGVRIDRSDTGKEANLQFSTAGAVKWWFQLDNNSTDNFYLFDAANAQYRMTWLQNGNIGIGTTSPSNKLHVSTGTPTSVTTPLANTAILIDSTGDQYLEFRTSGASSGYMQGSVFTDNGRNAFIGYKEYTGAVAGTYGEAIHLVYYDYSASDSNSGLYIGSSTTPASGVSNVHVFVKGNGNVGIGTTSPAYKLDVNGTFSVSGTSTLAAVSITGTINSSVTEAIRVNNNNGFISFYNSAGSTRTGYLQGNTGSDMLLASENSAVIRFAVGGSEVARISTNGNVGIGTTSPTTKLQVRDGAITAGTTTSTSGTTMLVGQYTDGYLTVLGTEQSSGGPMLGYAVTPSTSSPGAFLSSTGITIPRSAYIQDGGTHRWYIGASQTVAIGSAASLSERMRINSDGNLGIGVTSNLQPLSVGNSSANTFGLLRTGVSAVAGNTGPSINFYLSQNATTSLTGDANLARILANPIDGWGGYLQFFTKQNDGVPGNSPVVRMTIDTAGNVGIGTTSPSNKLHVSSGDTSVALFGPNTSWSAYLAVGAGNSQIGTKRAHVISTDGNLHLDSGTSNQTYINYYSQTATYINSQGGQVTIGSTNADSGCVFTVNASNAARMSITDGTTRANFWPTGGAFYMSTETNSPMIFITNAGERMRIAANGNVGIGSSSPGYLLDVNGNSRIGSNTAQSAFAALNVSAGAGLATTYRDIDIKGNWAGGEGHAITANHGTIVTNIVGQIVFQHDSPGSRIKFGRLYHSGDQSTYPMELISNGSNAYLNLTGPLYVSGNVGVGITTPISKLNVYASGSNLSVFRADGGNGTLFEITDQLSGSLFSVNTISGVPALEVFSNNTIVAGKYGSNVLVITGSCVGIGTSAPATKLDTYGPISLRGTNVLSTGTDVFGGLSYDIYGNIRVLRSTSAQGDGMYIGYAGSGGPLRFFSNSGTTEWMTVAASGFVGISTTSPGDRFQVNLGSGENILANMTSNAVSSANKVSFRLLELGSVSGEFSLVRDGTSYQVKLQTLNNQPLSFGTNATTRMVLDTNGNLGIGSTAPGALLNIRASSPSGTGGVPTGTNVLIDSNTSNYLTFRNSADNGTYAGLIFLDNNIGGYIVFRNYTADGIVAGSDCTIYGTFQDHIFQNGYVNENLYNRTETMRIKQNGNVGIGTNNPFSKTTISRAGVSLPTTADSTNNAHLTLAGSNSLVRLQFGTQNVTPYGGWIQASYDNTGGDNGVEPILINPLGGNVGIGTDNPTARLHIVQVNSGGVPAIRLSSDESTIQGPSANTQIRMGSNLVLNASNVMPFNVNASETMRIINNGNIGIGTTTPLGKLHVYGLLRVGGAANEQTGIIALGNDANPVGTYGDNGMFRGGIGTLGSANYTNISSYQGIVFNVGNAGFGSQATRMLIDVNGNVGIGITGPVFKLDVNGTSGFRDTMAFGPSIGLISWGSMGGGTGFGIRGESGRALSLGSNGNWDYLVINTSGNVGIGTTSPLAKLQVNSTTAGATLLRADGTNGTLFSVIDDLSDSLMSVNNSAGLPVLEVFADDRIVGGQYGANDFVVRNNKVGIGTNNPIGKLHVTGSTSTPAAVLLGDVGIGTTAPTSQANYRFLQVNGPVSAIIETTVGGTRIGGFDSVSNALYVGTIGSFPIVFRTAVNEKMRIASNGSVGIGTSSPATLLHVRTTSVAVDLRVEASNEPRLQLRTNDSLANVELFNSYGNTGLISYRGVSGGNYIMYYDCGSGTGANGYTEFQTNGISRLYIKGDGNVGVGTTSPTAKLHVSGSIYTSGKLVQRSTTQTITGTNQTLTLNLDVAAVHVVTMTSGATITTISYSNRDSNPSVNTLMLVVKYGGAASITFTNVIWANGVAPTLTATNGYADAFMLTSYQGGAGTPVWIGTVVAQALVSTNL